MSYVWDDGSQHPAGRVGPAGRVLAGLRGALVGAVLALGLVLMVPLRLLERPLFGPRRPLTPWITEAVCTLVLLAMGLRLRVSGHAMRTAGAIVSNHSSWLDIFVLNARRRLYVVAKEEVRDWPFVGWLVKATGSPTIRRERRDSGNQVANFRDRFSAGHRLLFFPEATTSDGRRVLPFKPTLFAALFDPALRDTVRVQPVTVIYRAPRGHDARFYGWWGDMTLRPHLLAVLGQWRQGEVEVIFHEPVSVAEFADRKALAAYCEATVRAPLDLELAQS